MIKKMGMRKLGLQYRKRYSYDNFSCNDCIEQNCYSEYAQYCLSHGHCFIKLRNIKKKIKKIKNELSRNWKIPKKELFGKKEVTK